MVYLVFPVCLVKQDQPNEQNKPNGPNQPTKPSQCAGLGGFGPSLVVCWKTHFGQV